MPGRSETSSGSRPRPGLPPQRRRYLGPVPAMLLATVLAACSGGSAPAAGPSRPATGPLGTGSRGAGSPGAALSGAASPGSGSSGPGSAASRPASPATPSAGPGAAGSGSTGAGSTRPVLAALRGKVITVDPGHNGDDWRHPSVINRKVFIGNGYKACDTTGTQTDAGYSEHAFTWDLASRLAGVLRSAGARVVLTRSSDAGVGPCIVDRAAIGNRAGSDLAISLHADGGPARGSGFHVIEPAAVGANAPIVAPSRRLGGQLRDAFRAGTGEPYADYIAHHGIDVRSDLGGLNLSRVPKVFLECGNMRNAGDAHRLTSSAWRQRAAVAIATGMAAYLSGR